MAIWDDVAKDVGDAADAVADVATSAVDWSKKAVHTIGEAGDAIGAVMKTLAPFAAFIPGLGTAISVAVYAAGAATAGDKVTDAIIGTASAAMPPGIPRIAFDTGTSVAKEVASGRPILNTMLQQMKQTANNMGPQVGAAFDSGIAMIQGGKIDQRLIDEGRTYAITGGGQAAGVAYDAGIAVAKGGGGDDVTLAIARGYISDQGGPLAAAAFDTGIALGYGKTLQEAGWIGLQTYVKGNTAAEQILEFVKQVGKAKSLGMALDQLLTNELVADFIAQVKGQAITELNTYMVKAQNALEPMIAAIKENTELLNHPAGELASAWGVAEEYIRAAKAVMRTGQEDMKLLTTLTGGVVPDAHGVTVHSIGSIDAPGYRVLNDAFQQKGAALAAANPRYLNYRNSGGRSNSQWRYQGLLTDPSFTLWRRGFDIGLYAAISANATTWTPSQISTGNQIPNLSENVGFHEAVELAHFFNDTDQTIQRVQTMVSTLGRIKPADGAALASYRAKGGAIAASNATVNAARALYNDGNYQYGFDIATAACQGKTVDGPEQQAVRSLLAPALGTSATAQMAQKGFDVGQATQFGISKLAAGISPIDVSGHPVIAAGQVAMSGLAGSGLTDAAKTNVGTALTTNPASAAGAANAVAAHDGIFTRILRFFGLA